MSKVSKTLSLSDVNKRIEQLNADEKKAQEAFEAAALAEATETGTEEETIEAKRALDAIRTKREVLRAAMGEAKSQASKAAVERARNAHKELVAKTEEDLAERAKVVASIVNLSDKLGAALSRYFDLQEKLRRQSYNFVRDYRQDLPNITAMDGVTRALGMGHDVRLVVGSTIERQHDVKLAHIVGDRHSLRGKDATDLDAQFAEKVLFQVEALAPEGGK